MVANENLLYEESKATVHTREYQFKDSMPTVENMPTVGNREEDASAIRLDDIIQDDVRYLDPIAKILNIGS